MQTTRRVFTFALFLSALFLSSAKANAQTAVDYRFLEVLDVKGKPLADAKVESLGSSYVMDTKRTDKRGQVAQVPVYSGDYTTIAFKVSKPGYLPYEVNELFERRRYGVLFEDTLSDYDDKTPIRVVLLKVPAGTRERKAFDAEQLRREMLLSIKRGDAATVERLLRAGVSPDAADFNGIPAILWASVKADGRIIKALLATGADVRNKDRPEHKALVHYLFAASPNTVDIEVVRSLITAGADVNAANKYGSTVLNLAERFNNPELVKLLEEAGAR